MFCFKRKEDADGYKQKKLKNKSQMDPLSSSFAQSSENLAYWFITKHYLYFAKAVTVVH